MRERFVACPTCEGRGSHTNPAVDGNGLTAEDFDELGEDFREDYLAGVYDVPCSRCRGDRVVPACRCGRPVEEGVTGATGAERPYSACWAHLPEAERREAEAEAAYWREVEAERRVGA